MAQTPNSLVSGTRVVIPPEVMILTARTKLCNQEKNDKTLAEGLHMVNQHRDLSKIRRASYHQRISKSYNKTIRIRRLQVGDLVLRIFFQITVKHSAGKLAPIQEGSYIVDSEAGKGAHWLSSQDGQLLPRCKNDIHLKTYFS